MDPWYKLSWQVILTSFNVNRDVGLSDKQVIENRNKYGKNKIQEYSNRNNIFKSEFVNIWNVVMILNLAYILILGYYSYFTITIILYCLTIYFILTMNKNKNQDLNPFIKGKINNVSVIRNNKIILILEEEVVVGDIILIEKGLLVPADIRIIDSFDIKVKDESLTGDDEILNKYARKIDEEVSSLKEIENMIFKSSVVLHGEGLGIVVSSGMNTVLGKILSNIYNSNKEAFKFKIQIRKLMDKFAILSLIVFGVVNTIVYLITGKVDFYNLKAISLMPINIFLGIIIYFKVGILTLKKQGIVLKDLASMDKIAKMSLLVIDKFGSVTENKYYVKGFFADNEIYVGGFNLKDEYNLKRLVETGLMTCNVESILRDDKNYRTYMDKGLIEFGRSNGLDIDRITKISKRIFYIPYDSERKISTFVNQVGKYYIASSTGTLDSLVNRCSHIKRNGIEIDFTVRELEEVKKGEQELLDQGYEVFAYANRTFNYQPNENENIESHLSFIGLIAFENPLKLDAVDLIIKSNNLNIKVIFDTEESKLPARRFGNNIKILNNDEGLITGDEIRDISKNDFSKLVDGFRVLSKISTSQKNIILKYLNKKDFFSAITVNRLVDISVFNEAKIIISVNHGLSVMFKDLADVSFKDNNLHGLLKSIESIRLMFYKIQRVLIFLYTAIVIQGICLIFYWGFLKETIINEILFWQINQIWIPVLSIILFLFGEKISLSSKKIYTLNKRFFEELTIDKSKYWLIMFVVIIFTLRNINFIQLRDILIVIYCLVLVLLYSMKLKEK